MAGLGVRLAAPPEAGNTLTQDAFVWQRSWTPSLAGAVAAQSSLFTDWHVLTAEFSPTGTAMAHPDWAALLAGGHAAHAVLRIEAPLDAGRMGGVLAGIAGVVANLPPAARRIIEIDHDAATSHLLAYAGFLRSLRAALPGGTSLDATALPTWIGQPGFFEMAQAVDRLVLQVHAAGDPRLGVFDPGRALADIRYLARETTTPFLVSLPAYEVGVSELGGRLHVASETPMLDGQAGMEMAASPEQVASFLAQLRADPPPTLAGLVWFRLPLPGDRRVWTMQTLRAVMLGQKLDGRVAIASRAGRIAGVTDIVLQAGGTDARLPDSIALPPGCSAADGLGRYVIDGDRLVLRGRDDNSGGSNSGGSLLPAHATLLAGWTRCGAGPEAMGAQN